LAECQISNISGHAPGDQVGQGRRTAVVVDVRHLDPGALLEHLAGKMADPARSRRGEIERLDTLFRDRDQFRDGIGRERLVGDERDRLGRHHAHGSEILLGVVGQLLADGRIDQQRVGGDQHGVAVGGRLGERRRRHDRAGARAVLDHDGLASPARGEEIREDARHHVGRPAGRERHQELHRPRGKVGRALRRRAGGGGEQRESCCDCPDCFHCMASLPANSRA
jgi:hypothetical protein